ncbi:uncharacterized protein TNCT_554071 [Trichonephila clavata]|uniref:Uncharacterized protein n=1 Tax=Trichonephila clavata TaxID=2740835 RepID=A0A8X6FHV2_TRICU|nr:uncharacterized protein TNCT_554071 [Trichonephila clavata]
MKIMSKVRKSLNSGISMKCEMCNFQEIIWTEDPHNEKMPVNTAAVSGIMKINGAWEKVAEREMYCAAMEEKQLAVQAGEMGPDGFPMLTVVVDGCWAKLQLWDFEQKKLYTWMSETDTLWSALEQQLRTNRLTDIAVVKIGTVAPRAWKQTLFKKDL